MRENWHRVGWVARRLVSVDGCKGARPPVFCQPEVQLDTKDCRGYSKLRRRIATGKVLCS